MNVVKACHKFDSCIEWSMKIVLPTSEWKTVVAHKTATTKRHVNAPFPYVEL